MKNLNLLSVGWYKGEMDFSINGSVSNLSHKDLKDFREMIIVAIWCAEDMWRRNHESEAEKKENK